MKIVAITGTLGAGKGTIVSYLVKKKGFVHYSVRDFLLEEIHRRNLPANRDNMRLVANELRANNSPSYIIDCLFDRAKKEGKDAVIESVRTPGEVLSLRQQKDFLLLAIDAEPAIRYKRIVLRNTETDQVSFEEFLQNEQREFNNEDPNKQNLSRCIAMADYVLNNNANIAELYNQLDTIF